MYSPQITALSGVNFQNFLKLLLCDTKSPESHSAWKKLRQDIKLFSQQPNPLDLNSVFVDLMTLKMLIYPILEDSNQSLKPSEWESVATVVKSMESRLKKIDSRILQMKKEEPEQALQLSPLVEQIRTLSNTAQNYWNTYQESWRQFQFQDTEAEEDPVETPSTEGDPPRFNREGWQVVQISFKVLMTELAFRAKNKTTEITPEEIADYPIFPILINQIQEIEERAQGFELLEKVKLVQARYKQLAQTLQFFYGDSPILPEKEKKQSSTEAETPPQKSQKALPVVLFDSDKRKKWLWALPLLGGLLVLIIFLSQSEQKPSSIKPGFGGGGKGPANFNLKEGQKGFSSSSVKKELEQWQNSQSVKIPVQDLTQDLKEQLSSLTDDMTQSLLQQITNDLQELMVLLADETSAFLVSAESLHQFDSFAELEAFLNKIEEQYQKILELTEVLKENLTKYSMSLEVKRLDGKPAVFLVLKDKQNRVMGTIGVGGQGLELRWGASNSLLVVRDSQELINAIEKLEQTQ